MEEEEYVGNEPYLSVFIQDPLIMTDPEVMDPDLRGNLLVTDIILGELLKIDLKTKKITRSYAKESNQDETDELDSQPLRYPRGVYCSRLYPDIVFVCDGQNHVVRKFDFSYSAHDQVMQIVAGSGTGWEAPKIQTQHNSLMEYQVGKPSTLVSTREPRCIYLNSTETLMWVSFPWTSTIMKFNLENGIVERVWILANFSKDYFDLRPIWLAIDHSDESTIWFSPPRVMAKLRDEENGEFDVEIVCGDIRMEGFLDGWKDTARFRWITSAIVINNSFSTTIYMCDSDNHRIRKFSSDTLMVTTIIGTGDGESTSGPPLKASISNPRSITLVGDDLFIANGRAPSISICRNFVQLEDISFEGSIFGSHNHLNVERETPRLERVQSNNRLWIEIFVKDDYKLDTSRYGRP